MCQNRGWNSSRLLLALPYAEKSKSNVVLKTYFNRGVGTYASQVYSSTGEFSKSKAEGLHHVVQNWGHFERWIHHEMAAKVRQFSSADELSVWLRRSCAADVCLLLVSSLTLPPMLLSALSVRFTGRIRFGMANSALVNSVLDSDEDDEPQNSGSNSDSGSGLVRNNGSGDSPVPPAQRRYFENGRYLLFTPGFVQKWRQFLGFNPPESTNRQRSLKPISYFGVKGDRISFSSIYSWLRWLTPDLNDIFVWSLTLVNLLAVMSIFDLFPPILADMNRSFFLWHLMSPMINLGFIIVKYNILLLMGWILVLALARFEPTLQLGQLATAVCQQFAESNVGRQFVRDIERATSSAWPLTTVLFVVLNGLQSYCKRKLQFYRATSHHRLSVSSTGGAAEPFIEPEQVRNAIDELDALTLEGQSLLQWLASYRTFGPELHRSDQSDFEAFLGRRHRLMRISDDMFVSASSDDVTGDETDSATFAPRGAIDAHLLSLIQLLHIDASRIRWHPRVSYEYIDDLAVWKYSCATDECVAEELTTAYEGCHNPSTDYSCAICLDSYVEGQEICGLPCLHNYHRGCIVSWLLRDQPICPVCRWPANKPKTGKGGHTSSLLSWFELD